MITAMTYEFGMATTDEERRGAQRVRYDVYVDELGRYKSRADHDNRIFVEPEDDTSWLFYAREGDEYVGTVRLTWGGHGFSERQLDQYRLEPFLAAIPAEMMVIGERAAVCSRLRGTTVLEDLLGVSSPVVDKHGVHVFFGCCEPHLLSLYIGMGQRPYADRNINSDEAGYLIPIVWFMPNADVLRGMGDAATPNDLPTVVERALASTGSVTSLALTDLTDYWSDVRTSLEELHAQQVAAFDDFTDDEAERCIARSNIIECNKGDHVLKKGGTARNIFVVLHGTLEVHDGERIVGVLSTGDAFGEMAFLLEKPRSFDVFAATNDARILSLSEHALRTMIAEDPVIAAKLLLNLSKMLCNRLIKAD
jgi:hypothetical protein